MFEILKKYEGVLVKVTCIQFIFLIIAQILLYKKEVAPYISKTIFSEGVFIEYVYRTMETLDQLTTIWYHM
ncbi:hypothetical protein DS745_00605 [Anaerobacillus alkaliphilus]|uniref:Uncharacterized protein n=1 Tax=Anaerobacillus alkaliphilus TaxID=1548597 RepID=A0A4V1LGU2_9BACI|nr:DUF5359 family protein [Anaerobacillus alkaliphilus]RXJ03925.1 hypothetical protein DS745_00605 [Anaerobacillus alkaliphilus]